MPLSLQHLGEAVSSNLLLADQKHFGDQPGDAWQLSALSWAARLRGSQKPTCGCTPSSRPRARSGEVMHDDLRPADQTKCYLKRTLEDKWTLGFTGWAMKDRDGCRRRLPQHVWQEMAGSWPVGLLLASELIS